MVELAAWGILIAIGFVIAGVAFSAGCGVFFALRRRYRLRAARRRLQHPVVLPLLSREALNRRCADLRYVISCESSRHFCRFERAELTRIIEEIALRDLSREAHELWVSSVTHPVA